MSAMTKDQIQRLTPAAQEAVANLALRRVALLEKAKRYRGQMWIPSFVPAALMLLFIFGFGRTLPSSDRLVIFVMLMIVSGSALIQTNGINRRLDALMELLEEDLRGPKTPSYEEAEPDSAANGASPRR